MNAPRKSEITFKLGPAYFGISEEHVYSIEGNYILSEIRKQ